MQNKTCLELCKMRAYRWHIRTTSAAAPEPAPANKSTTNVRRALTPNIEDKRQLDKRRMRRRRRRLRKKSFKRRNLPMNFPSFFIFLACNFLCSLALENFAFNFFFSFTMFVRGGARARHRHNDLLRHSTTAYETYTRFAIDNMLTKIFKAKYIEHMMMITCELLVQQQQNAFPNLPVRH